MSRSPSAAWRRDHSRAKSKAKADPAKPKKAKLYCKQFLDTGECDRTKRGEKCDPHLTTAMLAALKNVYGENVQGYYNPK